MKTSKKMVLKANRTRKKLTPQEEAIMFLADCIQEGSWQNISLSVWNILNKK